VKQWGDQSMDDATLTDGESRRLEALHRYGILDTPREAAFDEVARLAADLCGTPIGVVNLIDRDRQFFKAEVGLGIRETPLETSFCAHAILQEDFLLVPDATQDPRFDCNPLVTGEPHLRFYAGALLKTTEGLPIGTLCVLDTEPRTLGEVQQRALKVLANQLMTQLDLRLAIEERSEREERYRTLFDSMDEGFCVIEFLDGPDGPLSDYVHVEANAAYELNAGIPNVVGQKLREMVPAEADDWVERYGSVLSTGVPIRFEQELVATGRYLSLSAFRIEPPEQTPGGGAVPGHHRAPQRGSRADAAERDAGGARRRDAGRTQGAGRHRRGHHAFVQVVDNGGTLAGDQQRGLGRSSSGSSACVPASATTCSTCWPINPKAVPRSKRSGRAHWRATNSSRSMRVRRSGPRSPALRDAVQHAARRGWTADRRLSVRL
jgi:PAS domain-containing protein